jgi:hypothetical protein
MKQSSYIEYNSISSIVETLWFLCDPTVQYDVYKGQPLASVLGKLHLTNNFMYCNSDIHFNIIPPLNSNYLFFVSMYKTSVSRLSTILKSVLSDSSQFWVDPNKCQIQEYLYAFNNSSSTDNRNEMFLRLVHLCLLHVVQFSLISYLLT